MSNYIIYDLETSSLTPSGQILTYSFQQIDSNFNVIDTCEGEIKVSRLQLPTPTAITINRVDVQKHQQDAERTEFEAMKHIHDWIRSKTEQDITFLVGNNSYRFDLPYLRTSLVRNGFNPYFGKNLLYRDLSFCVRHVFTHDTRYRTSILKFLRENPNSTVKSLETVSIVLGVLDTNLKQNHNASDDVELTFKVMQKLNPFFIERYGEGENDKIPIIEWLPYSAARKAAINKRVVAHITFKNDALTEPFIEFFYLYNHKKNNALWLNLSSFINSDKIDDDFRDHMKWINTNDGYLEFIDNEKDLDSFLNHHGVNTTTREILKDQFSDKLEVDDISLDFLGNVARDCCVHIWEEQHINTENFLRPINCDIESFIYRIPFQGINCLTQAIHHSNLHYLHELDDKVTNDLYKRFYLTNGDFSKLSPKKRTLVERGLLDYVQYRYGDGIIEKGRQIKMKINKFNFDHQHPNDDGAKVEDFHPTLVDLFDELERKKEEFKNDKETLSLLSSLEQFYNDSIVTKTLNNVRESTNEHNITNSS